MKAALVTEGLFSLSSMLFFILLIVTYVYLNNSDYTYMQSIGINWNKGPITAVRGDPTFCSHTENSLITDYWPGTVDGCNCPMNLDLFNGQIRIGYCRRKRDNAFCTTMYPTTPINYQKWKGLALCAEKIPATYLDLRMAAFPKLCPLNTRSCGIIDSLNNVMCVPIANACPYNYFNVIPSSQATPTDKNYTVISTDANSNSKLLFANDNINGKILNEFAIGDDIPCANPYYKNSPVTPYKLDPYFNRHNCNQNVGNFSTDPRYDVYDSYSNYNLFRDNGILNVIQRLPLYPPGVINHNVNLYGRNYIGLAPACLAQIRDSGLTNDLTQELINISGNMSTSIGLAFACMIIGMIIFILVIIYVIIMLCLFCSSGISDDIDDKGRICILILPWILAVAVFICCAILTSIIVSSSSHYKILTHPECVDSITYQAASNFDSNIMSAKGMLIVASILSVLMVALPILETIFLCIKD